MDWSSGCLLELLSSGSIESLGKLLELLSSCSALGLLSENDELLSYVIQVHLRSSSECFNSSSISVAGDTPGAFYDSFKLPVRGTNSSYFSARSHAPEFGFGALLGALELCPRVLFMTITDGNQLGFY